MVCTNMSVLLRGPQPSTGDCGELASHFLHPLSIGFSKVSLSVLFFLNLVQCFLNLTALESMGRFQKHLHRAAKRVVLDRYLRGSHGHPHEGPELWVTLAISVAAPTTRGFISVSVFVVCI